MGPMDVIAGILACIGMIYTQGFLIAWVVFATLFVREPDLNIWDAAKVASIWPIVLYAHIDSKM